jgi:tetratricopeptide (TPR) repeat protein
MGSDPVGEETTLPTGSGVAPPLRVEQALRLIPDVELLGPLRALLLASSRQDNQDVWASSAPYLTVGKRFVQAAELERRMPEALDRARQHLSLLYGAVITALEAEQRGETAAAVAALLEAGNHEELIGRPGQARAWYDAAQGLSEGLANRLPELSVLNRLGRLELEVGHYAAAARHYQRALALAEAAQAAGEAIDACQGLGAVAMEEGNLFGAQAWYQRGLQLAEREKDPLRSAKIQHQLALVALGRADLTRAGDYLERAREGFERLGASLEMARAMNSQGQLDAALGRPHRTSGAYREALAWCRRSGGAPDLEVTIRLNLAELYLAAERVLEAEEEARRGEQLAIERSLTRRLVPIYLFLGRLRGGQGDDGGFVFFEKALELCRQLSVPPGEEGQAYHQYAMFREQLGQREEARALLERAGEILALLGEVPELKRVRAGLRRLSA